MTKWVKIDIIDWIVSKTTSKRVYPPLYNRKTVYEYNLQKILLRVSHNQACSLTSFFTFKILIFGIFK